MLINTGKAAIGILDSRLDSGQEREAEGVSSPENDVINSFDARPVGKMDSSALRIEAADAWFHLYFGVLERFPAERWDRLAADRRVHGPFDGI